MDEAARELSALDPNSDEAVDVCLGSAAGHLRPARQLEHPDAGTLGEHPQDTPVDGVEGLGHERTLPFSLET